MDRPARARYARWPAAPRQPRPRPMNVRRDHVMASPESAGIRHCACRLSHKPSRSRLGAEGPPLSRAQSIFSPSAFTTGVQSATSAASDRAIFRGLSREWIPYLRRSTFACRLGSATTVRVACAICSMIAVGVPAGASSPMEPVTVIPGNPSSAAVGSSGAAMRRVGPVTASTRILPVDGIRAPARSRPRCPWEPGRRPGR